MVSCIQVFGIKQEHILITFRCNIEYPTEAGADVVWVQTLYNLGIMPTRF